MRDVSINAYTVAFNQWEGGWPVGGGERKGLLLRLGTQGSVDAYIYYYIG
jgi:hypothetical protein